MSRPYAIEEDWVDMASDKEAPIQNNEDEALEQSIRASLGAMGTLQKQKQLNSGNLLATSVFTVPDPSPPTARILRQSRLEDETVDVQQLQAEPVSPSASDEEDTSQPLREEETPKEEKKLKEEEEKDEEETSRGEIPSELQEEIVQTQSHLDDDETSRDVTEMKGQSDPFEGLRVNSMTPLPHPGIELYIVFGSLLSLALQSILFSNKSSLIIF
ncbi:neurofilament light polypeptide-like [Planoprotostelium fungivorum]|uniref:Neurofilament light polypeptide-like n=1 Tax=Planoprotostelium fungivorum TaxID=1890364 RepID=A0A2P6N8I8_9EUKA|nr:neurofilament light polypeptide-like [Planoprotostelium fungivorum]